VTEEAEGTGETVGEAKWAALRELERRVPGLDKGRVSFTVLSEGERGLLGVGYAPARVLARVDVIPSEARAEPGEAPPAAAESATASRLRDLLERVCRALGVAASISVEETDSRVEVRLAGRDVALLIGKHGHTLDAIQHVAGALLYRDPETAPGSKQVVIDVAGYRSRRRAALERTADRAADDVMRSGQAVALEPMSAEERKIVHTHLQGRDGVETTSEGAEPNRYVVVRKSDDA
jgi:spoIIIJ-associated protein